MSQEQELLKLLLPEYLVAYFDFIKFEEKEGLLYLYFEEKSSIPEEFSSLALQS